MVSGGLRIMHDRGNHSVTVEALPQIINSLKECGYHHGNATRADRDAEQRTARGRSNNIYSREAGSVEAISALLHELLIVSSGKES